MPCLALLVSATAASVAFGQSGPRPADTPSWNRDVRPILAEHCFSCHGPDKGARKVGLRLDQRNTALAELDGDGGRHAIVPGRPADSELVRRVTSRDPDFRMPRKHDRLPAEQIDVLVRWIAAGAQWQRHWSLLPPRRVERDGEAAPAAIDRLLRAGLARRGLEMSRAADPRTLVRRLHLDLTGLPPSAREVEIYAANPTEARYEQLVDRLLASPAYAERMTAYWLDLVRYADTVGYHGDQPISVWPYRDWVIHAFDSNMPFDRFTREQLAGDLLDHPTRDQRVASGYNRLNMMTTEGGAQDKEYLAKYAADRVRTTGSVWLGLTLGCAECHDHKFDPISTRDFYRFEAFFADIKEKGYYPGANTSGDWGPKLEVGTVEQERELARLDGEVARLTKVLDTQTPELAAAQARWEAQVRRELGAWVAPELGPWHVLGPFRARNRAAAHRHAYGPEHGVDLSARVGTLRWTARPEWKDGRVHNTLRGANSATYLSRTIRAQREQSVKLSLGSDDSIKLWINGTLVLDRDVARAAAPDQERVTVPLHAGDNRLLMKICNGAGDYGFYFRLIAPGPGAKIAALVTKPHRTPAEDRVVAAGYRRIAPKLEPVRAELARVEKQRSELHESIPTTLVTVATTPRTMRVLARGNWMDTTGEVVTPQIPSVFGKLTVAGRATRLDLANWIVSKDNPLTARVLVNRLWKLLFGRGLSRVLDDLGTRGEWPAHAELLDWLAVELVDSGWDIKHVVKAIVMSQAYRQSSALTPELSRVDPRNRLMARQSSFRIPAEAVRDTALFVSGLLSRRVGGPSVKPYQPAGYWSELNFPRRTYESDVGENQYRRGLYTHWQRSYLHPSLLAFDAPTREECTAERERSNTPLQSLVLLNDPTYVEAARVFAERILSSPARSDLGRIRFAFRAAVSRAPDRVEVEQLRRLLAEHKTRYRADPESADALLATGLAPVRPDLDRPELAAWTSIARVILNLHETVTRY